MTDAELPGLPERLGGVPPVDASARAAVRHLAATLAYRAAKVIGRVGPAQTSPRREFDGDASARG